MISKTKLNFKIMTKELFVSTFNSIIFVYGKIKYMGND